MDRIIYQVYLFKKEINIFLIDIRYLQNNPNYLASSIQANYNTFIPSLLYSWGK